MKPVFRQQPDGRWLPNEPLRPDPGYDAEIEHDGRWALYRDGDCLVGTGQHRNRFMRALAIWRAIRRDQKALEGRT